MAERCITYSAIDKFSEVIVALAQMVLHAVCLSYLTQFILIFQPQLTNLIVYLFEE